MVIDWSVGVGVELLTRDGVVGSIYGGILSCGSAGGVEIAWGFVNKR